MNVSDPNDTQIPAFDREALEIVANSTDGKKLLDSGSLDERRRLAIISAKGGYDQNSGQISGWITYGLFEPKIRFQTTTFTTRMLSFHGTGGFLNEALPLDRLAGKTGTFSMSGNKEVSMLWLWLGRDAVCVPLILIGEGGNGHFAEGQVRFWSVPA